MSKISMSTERGKGGLKSNVELGRELDFYLVSEIVGSGLPLFAPKGALIKMELERFIVDEELKRGYLYTATPVMAKSELYKISGHWQHYKEFMFTFKVGEEIFALRPMTCPFQFIIYKSRPRSYRELPLKYAEISNLFRNEKSGELMGLTRLRQFTLADAHVICKPEQLEEEFSKVLELIQYIIKTLGIEDIWYRFSKWDPEDKEKYIDNPKAWENSQKAMKKILDRLKLKYLEAENEAAFYGPKLDVQYKNVFGKEDTLITVQIDFALPEKFDLTYIDESNEKKRPMVIHRSSIGCFERTIAYILEKTQGNLPLWLSPLQVKIITVNDRSIPFARKVLATLKEKGVRAELNDAAETIAKKVRDAQLEKANYIVTIGDKEVEIKKLAVRTRSGEVKFGVDVEHFVKQLQEEINSRKAK
ncbi:MAG: threonine--tRNA ligase [Nanoarchaeota archaeon]